jgi:hypothetical protein
MIVNENLTFGLLFCSYILDNNIHNTRGYNLKIIFFNIFNNISFCILKHT